VLVDCGVHARGDIGTIADVARDVEQQCGGKLAVVIATHEHQDHLSGFAKCADVFSRIEVGEVWMPWVLDPANNQSARLRLANLQVAQELGQRLAASDEPAHQVSKDIVMNLVGNAAALDVLRGGFASRAPVKYLKAGDQLTAPGAISGLTVKILGPPQDEEFLAKMNPPAQNHYLTGAGDSGSAGDQIVPFAEKWSCPPDDLRKLIDFPPQDEEAVRKSAQGSPEALAAALDHAINNTSVVALMSFGGYNLLFPGDAQWGNWYWAEEKEDLLALLGSIGFYKVAHHGSFNATPKDALEAMPQDGHDGRAFVAMVSTQSKPWPSIPRIPLISALKEKTRDKLVRSDTIPVGDRAPVAEKMQELPASFQVGEFWVDYSIDV